MSNFSNIDYSKKRIIVVDDNNVNLSTAIAILKPYNMTIDRANSAEELFEGNLPHVSLSTLS